MRVFKILNLHVIKIALLTLSWTISSGSCSPQSPSGPAVLEGRAAAHLTSTAEIRTQLHLSVKGPEGAITCTGKQQLTNPAAISELWSLWED